MLAYQAGPDQIDGALCALGAGAGNAPTEVLAATFDRLGITTGVDVPGVLAAAEDVVAPFIPRLPWMDRSSIVQGYAGVYSSFLLHAQRAAERYGVPAHVILQRVGEAGYVGRPGRHDHRRRAAAAAGTRDGHGSTPDDRLDGRPRGRRRCWRRRTPGPTGSR